MCLTDSYSRSDCEDSGLKVLRLTVAASPGSAMQRFYPFTVVENAAFTVRRFLQHLEGTGQKHCLGAFTFQSINQTQSHALIEISSIHLEYSYLLSLYCK